MILSVRENILAELSAKRTCHHDYDAKSAEMLVVNASLTWVAMYANDPVVTEVMPWMCAFPDLVALGSLWSTELGDVNTCL